MIAKPFKGGRTYNGAIVTFGYLLNDRVSVGTSRVLKGDSEVTLALIKEASKKQKWSWSSGVLSFSETLDDDTKHSIMDDFEKVFFCGLSDDRYDITWINHEDKGRTELHYMSPRLELITGKALNLYFVKRDFRKKEIFQEYMNLKYGLTSIIDNPQLVSYKPDRIWEKELDLEERGSWRSVKKQIDKQLKEMVESGELQNRSDVIDVLRNTGLELGDKIKPNAIVLLDKDGKPHVLKGGFYREDFKSGVSDLRKKLAEKNTPSIKVDGEYKKSRDIKELRKALFEIVQKQAYGNLDTYGEPPVSEKPIQIASSTIKLEPRLLKMGISEDKSESAVQTAEEQKNTKKEQDEQRKRDRTRMDRILNEGREATSRRKKRISKSIRIATALHDSIRKSVTDAYKTITEAFEIGAERRELEENFKHAFLSIDGNIGEIKRGLIGRNNAVQRGFNQRNSRAIEAIKLIRNKSSDDVLSQARLRNAKARTRNKEDKFAQGKKLTI